MYVALHAVVSRNLRKTPGSGYLPHVGAQVTPPPSNWWVAKYPSNSRVKTVSEQMASNPRPHMLFPHPRTHMRGGGQPPMPFRLN